MRKILFSAVLALVMGPVLAGAATLSVYPSGTTEASYHDTVVKNADRILALQYTNGGWDWDVTGQSAPSSNTFLNVTGVTAEVLLSAYKITGNAVYLDAAKKAGDYIVATVDAATLKSINGYNLLFLQELSTVSGDATYAAKAAEYFSIVYSTTPTKLCASGCVDTAGLLSANIANRAAIGANNGVPAWDLVSYEEYALLAGNSTQAAEIENAITGYLNDPAYVSGVANYNLGLASGVKAAVLVGDAANKDAYAALLLTSDGSYGTEADGKIQTTAYVLKAFKQAGDITKASAAADYLIGKFSPTGAVNGWFETDGAANATEFAEDDSEAASAIALLLPSETRYYSIQPAVNAASAGDTVMVNVGTYNEQVVIDGKDLTLSGAGNTTIIQPANASVLTQNYAYPAGMFLPGGVTTVSGVILVKNATTTVQNLKVDGTNISSLPAGAGALAGIIYGESAGTINNVTVNAIKTTGYADRTYGIDVSAQAATTTVTISNSHVTDFARNGINANGLGLTANVTGNTITGPATAIGTAQVPNGIVFQQDLGGSITGNTISSLHYTEATTSWRGVGIMGMMGGRSVTVSNNEVTDVDDALDPSNNFVFTNNNLHGNGNGIVLESGETNNRFTGNTITANGHGVQINGADNPNTAGRDAPGTGNVIANNNISGNGVNAVNYDAATSTMANNWWGTADAADISDSLQGLINYSPWYADASMKTLKYPVTVDAEKTNMTIGSDDVTLSGTTGDVDVSVVVPASTVVTGSASWDGTIASPTATTTTVTVPGHTTTVTSAIAVGSAYSDLFFDRAAKLTFAGQAGKRVGWTNTAGTFAEIANVCTANDQATGDALPARGNCKIDAGSDLVVWTKHFTTFATYTASAIPPVSVTSGGGYFVVSNTPASNVAVTATASTPNTNGQVLGAQVSAVASQNNKGRVLGAEVYNFGRDLRFGSRGEDVAALQQMLMDAGFMRVASSTTYFGPITKAAVIKWQKKMNLPGTGYFGKLSRAAVIQ